MKPRDFMGVWQNLYYHAKEELDALLQRKKTASNSLHIDAQINEAQHLIFEAKSHLSQIHLI
jgi:hypothetical protein